MKRDTVRQLVDRYDYRLHDLRHTLATLLFDGGAAANDVQAIMCRKCAGNTADFAVTNEH